MSAKEQKELTTKQAEFVSAIVYGKKSVSAAAKEAGVAIQTGYNWYNDDDGVGREITRQLRRNNLRLRLRAAAHQDEMLDVLVGAATTLGAYSKIQVEAAKEVLKLGLVAEAVEGRDSGTKFEVIINNNTSDTAVEEQSARHNRIIEMRQPTTEAAFELIEDE